MRPAETATQKLHRITSYAPGRQWDEPPSEPEVVHDFKTNDLTRFPWFTKRYLEPLARVALPRSLPATSAPTVAVLAGTADATARPLDLAQLSRLLHLSAGIVRTMERPYATWLFRAAGSAGGRFPLELYVAVPAGAALPAGVHHYDPVDHALELIGPPPAGAAPSVVVTGIPWRTGWRYRERGFRHIYWDAGTMLAQLLAVADSSGLGASLYTRIPDADVSALVGADGVHEWPVAVVALGEGPPAIGTAGRAITGEVDAAPLEFPLVTAAQHAGDGEILGRSWPRGLPFDLASDGSAPIDDVVLRRGSQRRMDASRGLSGHVLRTSMRAAMRGIQIPHRIVVHDVESFVPGLYRWPDLAVAVRSEALRDELYRVCLGQALARDAAFVVIGATNVMRLDDIEYREVQLGAGLVEGRLHVLAYALGASASGMTFLDSEIGALLGEPLDGLLFTCVGVPEYRSSRGGLPGAPTALRPPG